MPKYQHRLEQKRNAWGTHNDRSFRPHQSGVPVRCPQCSSLLESGFLEENKCPICNYGWKRKAIARDMYIEALANKVNHGGWNREILEELEGKPSQVVSKDMHKKRKMDATSRAMAENFTRLQREQEKTIARLRQRGRKA